MQTLYGIFLITDDKHFGEMRCMRAIKRQRSVFSESLFTHMTSPIYPYYTNLLLKIKEDTGTGLHPTKQTENKRPAGNYWNWHLRSKDVSLVFS